MRLDCNESTSNTYKAAIAAGTLSYSVAIAAETAEAGPKTAAGTDLQSDRS